MLFPITGYEVLIALSFLIILFYPMVFQHYFRDAKSHQQMDFKVLWSSQGLWFTILRFSPSAMFSGFWFSCISKNNNSFLYFPILQSFQVNSIKLRPLTKGSSNFSRWPHVNNGIFFFLKPITLFSLVYLWYSLSQKDTINIIIGVPIVV